MAFEQATATKIDLGAKWESASKALGAIVEAKRIPGEAAHPMGLLPDYIRLDPEYRAAYLACDAARVAFQKFMRGAPKGARKFWDDQSRAAIQAKRAAILAKNKANAS
jgi:hypothetical protein